MPSFDRKARALRTFYAAHRFFGEFGIKWLPVDPDAVIDKRPNWHLKYVHQVAFETGQTEEHILKHVMRSDDGLSIYDVDKDSYDIIINAADGIPFGRIVWTKVHEIGHIYLGHLKDYNVTELRKDELGEELYDELEFEADLFAGEVLASKWLMRQLDIVRPEDISEICGISDIAALNRYKKATEDYDYIPPNVPYTLVQFRDYLKEITVCASYDDLEEKGRFATKNSPQPMFKKPMAPFLRKEGVCPYCGRNYDKDDRNVKFCSYCGSPLRKLAVNVPGVYCWHRQNDAEAAFCERCGNPVLRIRRGFCFEEYEEWQ